MTWKTLFVALLALAGLSVATAHAAGDKLYFDDLDGDCHQTTKETIADVSTIKDVAKDFCDGDHGKYIGTTHAAKRDGRCAEITPRSTFYKFTAHRFCEE